METNQADSLNLEYIIDWYKEKGYPPTPPYDGRSLWVPDEDERCQCCDIYPPGKDILTHCKTKEHIKNWILKQLDPNYISKYPHIQQTMRDSAFMTKETAPLYLESTNSFVCRIRDHLLGYDKECKTRG